MIQLVVTGVLLAADIAELKTAVERNPSNGVAWKELGIALAAQRESEPAIRALAKACELAPKDEDSCYFHARHLYAHAQYEEAKEPFQKALRASSKETLVRVHRAMALNFSALGSPDEAERHFQDAIRVSGGPPQLRADARIDYGAFLFRQARIAEALPLLKAAVAIAPGSARAHQELGRILLHLGKTEPAAATLEKAVELDAQSPQIRLLLGRAYLESGRSEEGEKQLRLGREGWDKSQGSSSVK